MQVTVETSVEDWVHWDLELLNNPEVASIRMLYEDLRHFGEVKPGTWQRFFNEEYTLAAEVLDTGQRRVEILPFDGRDIIVKESDGYNSQQTLRQVFQRGLDLSRQKVEVEPGLRFQLCRDEIFMAVYEEVERMMRGETEHDTIKMTSTCPLPEEIAADLIELGIEKNAEAALKAAKKLLKKEFYNLGEDEDGRGKSFQYIYRRTERGLETSTTRIDGSDLRAHDEVIKKSYGYTDIPSAVLASHDRGGLWGFSVTTGLPITEIAKADSDLYDRVMLNLTGHRYNYGRRDSSIEAHEFFEKHCPEYWAVYANFHTELADHFCGRQLPDGLKNYLRQTAESHLEKEKSHLEIIELEQLKTQLHSGKIELEMALACKKLLTYNHHATLANLLKEYNTTGRVSSLSGDDVDAMIGSYSANASSSGEAAVDQGLAFGGCGVGNTVSSIATASEIAAVRGISLEQAMRQMLQSQVERRRKFTIGKCQVCLEETKLFFFFVADPKTEIGECKVCLNCENIHNREGDKGLARVAIEAMKRLAKENSKVEAGVKAGVEPKINKELQPGQVYSTEYGEMVFKRDLGLGGAKISFVSPSDGREVTGMAAWRLEAGLKNQSSKQPG